MTLRVIDTGKIWEGEKVRGITYSFAVGDKLNDEELRERGLERVVDDLEPPALPPERKANDKTEIV